MKTKIIKLSCVTVTALALLSGCGSSSDTSSTDTSTGTSTMDITNAILTNRSANCEEYVKTYTSMVTDIQNDTDFDGSLEITVEDGKCKFTSNAIPNYDFNDGSGNFATDVSEQALNVEITTNPTIASTTTALSLSTDNAIFLNGVKVDSVAAGCYGVGNGQIGCDDMSAPYRYDPVYAGFGTDSHNAHTQPTGEYHYHASPVALFDTEGNSESPVIGFAADGFPIYGSYIDDNGEIRKVTSSYAVKTGDRITIDGINPGGSYTGEFVTDYEYVASSGDLDECNGMEVDGVYGYYITDDYPYVLGCYKGTTDSSFNKR